GKASVQNIMPLPDGSAVLYTIAKYLTPNGTDISDKGISVNIELTVPTKNIEMMKEDDFVYTFDTDYQLQEAIKHSLTQVKSGK
ncbi:MAG: carboxy- processing protease, partial [Candidatus Margulisbacteria bacterium]|nr:carboxy- processing protease [Candidatus Margulisiibacteriota bacterium]